MPPVDWRHVLFSVLRGGQLKGYHSRWLKQYEIVEEVIPKDVHGCFGAYYLVDGMKKFSIFFPDHWDLQILLSKVREAYLNPVEIGDAMLIGKTSEGLLTHFF